MDGGVTWSFELQEACGLRVGGAKQGAEEIFRAKIIKKKKVAKAWRKFYDLHGLCIQTDIIMMVK